MNEKIEQLKEARGIIEECEALLNCIQHGNNDPVYATWMKCIQFLNQDGGDEDVGSDVLGPDVTEPRKWTAEQVDMALYGAQREWNADNMASLSSLMQKHLKALSSFPGPSDTVTVNRPEGDKKIVDKTKAVLDVDDNWMPLSDELPPVKDGWIRTTTEEFVFLKILKGKDTDAEAWYVNYEGFRRHSGDLMAEIEKLRTVIKQFQIDRQPELEETPDD